MDKQQQKDRIKPKTFHPKQQSRTKCLEQSKEIEQNWESAENFDTVINSFISGRKTEY